MKTLKQSILSIAIGLALVAGISFAEWKGAQDNPPKSNASAPINVSTTNQVIGDSGLNQQNKNLSMGNGQGILGLGGSMNIKGSLNVSGASIFKGGTNKDGFTSFFPNANGKNYIRGTTVIADTDKNNYVGIGTDEPTAKLHLKAGNNENDPWAFRLEQGQIASGNILTSDANGNAYWAPPAQVKSFGGLFSLNNKGECRVGNPFTGTCGCPSGYNDFNFIKVGAKESQNDDYVHYCYR